MKKSRNNGLIWGSILILLGAGFLLQTMNIWDFGHVLSQGWPALIFIIAGAQYYAGKKKSALLWAIFALVLLLSTTNVLNVSFWSVFWPLILILIGLNFMLSNSILDSGDPHDHISAIAIFGGSEKKAESKNLLSANLISIFGGTKLDLRNAKLSEKGADAHIVALFGGSEIVVPKDMPVKIDVFALFGGSDDKRTEVVESKDKPYLYTDVR